MTCLLHRTGMEDRGWQSFLRGLEDSDDDDDDEEDDKEDRQRRSNLHFCKLLRRVVSGSSSGVRQFQVPETVDCSRLQETIRSEFRRERKRLDAQSRREVAFRALRELNRKLAFAKSCLKTDKTTPLHPQQCAKHVKALPLQPPSSYLRPGAYLLAHPLMTGYFRRSVICILDHVQLDDDNDDDEEPVRSKSYGTYGLIVNRTSTLGGNNRIPLTLPDILKPLSLPNDLLTAFGTTPVKEGGPVHFSLQMLHAAAADQRVETDEHSSIGGTLLPTIPADETESTATDTDKAVYYRGSIPAAAKALEAGTLDRHCDVALFVGCSVWSEGQLESEVERGFWLPCTGPAGIAVTGICDFVGDTDKRARPQTDLWLSMVSALGPNEKQLAHLLYKDDGTDENGAACDEE